MLPTISVEDQVNKVAQRLAEEFAGKYPDPVVRDLVSEEYGELKSATVTTFVPVFIDRNVRARLRTLQISA